MLTLPIKRKWLDMIVSGEKREEYREITDYWTKRFVNLLGESEDHANVILQNLRDHRIDKECEVLLQNDPDGSPQAVAVVTISIGGGARRLGSDTGRRLLRSEDQTYHRNEEHEQGFGAGRT